MKSGEVRSKEPELKGQGEFTRGKKMRGRWRVSSERASGTGGRETAGERGPFWGKRGQVEGTLPSP